MSKIDLTAAELREFAKSEGLASFELNDIQRRAWSRLCSHDARFPLALALADAMEERDALKTKLDAEIKVVCNVAEERGKLRADLEAARISQGTLNAAIRTGIEQESIILQLRADLEAARSLIAWLDEHNGECVYIEDDAPQHFAAWVAATETKK